MIKNVGTIIAADGDGNLFEKKVKIEFNSEKEVIHFGGPISYFVDDLKKNFPFTKPFCIDVGGRIHKDSSVFILPEDMNNILSAYFCRKHNL